MPIRPPRYFLLLDLEFQPVALFSNKSQLWEFVSRSGRFQPAFIGGYSKLQKFLRYSEHASFDTARGKAYILPIRVGEPISTPSANLHWRNID